MSGELRADEGTVATLSGRRVGIGNIWERAYVLPDGEQRRGVTAMLHFEDETKLVAGPGTELDLAGDRWRVTAVQAGNGGRGAVGFERVG